MKRKTKKQIVIEKLREQGYVDNYWALETKLTNRLAAIIDVLRNEGWQFDDARSGFIEGTKNFRYYLLNAPKPKPKMVPVFLPNGSVRLVPEAGV